MFSRPFTVTRGTCLLVAMVVLASRNATGAAGPWGEAQGGLRLRVVPVSAEMSEEKVSLDTALTEFERPQDVTFAVEIQNVSDQPVKLQGTRYGDSVSQPWPGKSVSNRFAPFLFRCEFTHPDGQPVARVERSMFSSDQTLMLTSGDVETLQPGESLKVLMRPALWRAPFEHELPAGAYGVRILYHGTPTAVRESIKERWPDNALAQAWSGNIVSGLTSFSVQSDAVAEADRPAWGPAVNGLAAAIEFRNYSAGGESRPMAPGTEVPFGSRISVRMLLKNVSEKDVSFWSEAWRQEDQVTVTDPAGNESQLSHTWYSGWATMIHWKLRPGEIARLSSIDVGVTKDSSTKLDHPIGPVISGKIGTYQVRYDVRLGSVQRTDTDGTVIIPGKNDWTGSLTTGTSSLTIRERRPADEPPTFTASLQFQNPDGNLVSQGDVQVSHAGRSESLFDGPLPGQKLLIPHCAEPTVTVYARLAGYEEQRFYDVKIEPEQTTTLAVTPAQPLKFRLLHQGNPLAQAKIRYFNRSKKKASAGPYPMKGVEGPLWATSHDDGTVVLDTLQLIDPKDTKLGNNIYFFYVEPAKLAPLFIGPVEAGQELGDIEVGEFLTVSGEVRGTAEELDEFDAEWDQPEPMKRGNGEVGWHYAQSQRLRTTRDGNVLKFELSGLRPGPFRVVSNFEPGTKSTRHVYSRREPGENDVVFQINLTESRDDIVITAEKHMPRR